jgi:hypothetical protein
MNLLGSHKPRRAIQRYRVKAEWLEPSQLAATLSIQQFVESAYFTRGDFLPLSPTGWKLEDELRNSITLRTFCSFVPHIELVVDVDDLSVVGLELYPA